MALTHFDTQRLTRARLELVAGRRRPAGWLAGVLAAVLALAAVLLIGSQEPGTPDLVGLLNSHRENLRLTGELQRMRVELEVEHATRTEVERRNQALGEQLTALSQQLDFVNSRTNAQTRTAPARPAPSQDPQE